jgi:hypothetical protein
MPNACGDHPFMLRLYPDREPAAKAIDVLDIVDRKFGIWHKLPPLQSHLWLLWDWSQNLPAKVHFGYHIYHIPA